MPWYCYVLNCDSRTGDGAYSMHRFPNRSVEPERYQKWQDFCQFSSQPGVCATICSLHFAPEMFVRSYGSDLTGLATLRTRHRNRVLRKDAVPSVNGPAELRARVLNKTSAADKPNQLPVGILTGVQKSRKAYNHVETNSTNLPSLPFSEDNADCFVSIENLPIFCKPCQQHSNGGPCWTHARTVADRICTPLAIASLPEVLYFEPTDEVLGKSVHTSVFIPLHTVFGPLITPLYSRSASTSNSCQTVSSRLNDFQMENDHFCNWLKYVRTAEDPTEQNLAVCFRGIDVMFVTTRPIQPHEELKVYHPLLDKINNCVSFPEKTNHIEFDVIRDDTAVAAAVNGSALLTTTAEAHETDSILDGFIFNDGAESMEDMGSPSSADDEPRTESADLFSAEPTEPETATTSSNISSDAVLYQFLPPNDSVQSCRSDRADVTARRIKRSAVFERSLAGDVQVTQKRRYTRRPECVSLGKPLAARSSSVSPAATAKCHTAPLPPGSSPAVPNTGNQNFFDSRLSSLRNRKSKPSRFHTSTLGVSVEGSNDKNALESVADSVPLRKKDKITEVTTFKRTTRLSEASSRPREETLAPSADAVDYAEMDLADAMFEEEDADYIPSDESESDSLPARKQRAVKAIKSPAPVTESSSTGRLVHSGAISRKTKRKTQAGPFPMQYIRSDYDAFLYRYPCAQCPLKFYSTRILNLHKYQHEDESGTDVPSDLKCIDSDCGYTGTDAMDLAQHTNNHGKIVGEMIEHASAEAEHRSHAHCYSYACENQDCHRWFCTETLWRQHRLVHYPLMPVEIESFQCTACDYLATDCQDLAQHVTGHGKRGTARVQCPVCFHNVIRMKSHYLRTHPDFLKKASLDFPLPCPNCSLRFATEYTLAKHRRFCKRKLNQCYMCAIQFETTGLLMEHLDSHLINGKFPCPDCDFLTTTYEYISRHIKCRHEVSRIRVCEICQKVVNSSKRLNIHMRTHNQTMEFLCDLCGKRYNSSFSLRQHKRYIHGVYLKAHLNRKAQEKKAKGEVIKPSEKRHLALEDYPHRCEQCQIGFLKYGLLFRHMQDKHTE